MTLSSNIKDREFDKFRESDDGGTVIAVTNIDIPLGTFPQIFNVLCADVGTEYSQMLPNNTKSFIIKAKGLSRIDLSYQFDADITWTIFPGNSFSDNNFYLSQTLYFKCSKPDEIVEIVSYS